MNENLVLTDLIASLESAVLTLQPWPHAHISHSLAGPTVRELATEFPAAAIRRDERRRGAKTYSFGTMALDGNGSAVPAIYGRLYSTLHSERYRSAMSRLTGCDLSGCQLDVHLWEYRAGDWLSAHLDKPDKVVTQIFYLTDAWQDGDGGRLLILRGPTMSLVHTAYPPLLGSSVVLVRSERSWHAVEMPESRSCRRRSITATFHRDLNSSVRPP